MKTRFFTFMAAMLLSLCSFAQTKYYFYIGVDNPMEMSSISGRSDIISVADRANETTGGWFEIGTSIGTYSRDNALYNYDNVKFGRFVIPYVALPRNSTLQMWNGLGASDMAEWTYTGTKLLDNVEYDIYERKLILKTFSSKIYDGPPVTLPEIKYYFYIGADNPLEMTEITNPISVADRYNETTGGWFEIGTTLGTYNQSSPLYNCLTQNAGVYNINFGERVCPYIALPNKTLQMWNGLGGNGMSEWAYQGTKLINNVTYYIYVSKLKVRGFTEMIYDGSPVTLPAAVVTADDLTMEYGDDMPKLTYKLTYMSDGFELNGTPELSTNATKTSSVGTYGIMVEKGSVTNENVDYKKGSLTVTKAPLTITAQNYTIKQGEALPTFAATYSGFKNNETDGVLTTKPTFSCTATSASAPGTYDITVSGAEAGNYEMSYVKGTLTIEKKDEPGPIKRSPFKGEISLPGTLEAENFDKGGEGITYHDNDAEDHGGTNYRSGDDLGMDIVTGNGGYAIGWTNGGEWIEYSVNVTKAGKYTYEAIISNGTADKGGFSISLVGKDGKLTKLADVIVPSTESNWDKYQPVKGDLLQSLEAGSQIFRVTITDGNCNIDKVSFELKKDEPEPVTITANNQSMVYGGNVPSLTYKTEGASLSGTPKLSTTATKTSAVGTYPIKVEKGTVTNTSVTFVDGTLTITKAPLTITAKSYTIQQGETLPTFAATYSGFKNSETESVLTKKPTFSCTATSASAPGTYDITVSGAEAGNYEMSYVKGTLTIEKKDEPAPTYKVGDDITSLATAEWEGMTADYGGLANPAVERYTHAAPDETGDILTQTVTGLKNGTYKVQLDVAASFTPDRGFTCPTGDGLSVAFANGAQENLPVVERGWVGEGEQNIVTLATTVTDGTLKYGIKNLAPSGNWFVARVSSIVYVSESEQLPDAIEDVIAEDGSYEIYTLDGKKVESLQKGVNIIKYKNCSTQKVYVK